MLTSGHSDHSETDAYRIALSTVNALFANWAVPCLFLTVILIAKHRHEALVHEAHLHPTFVHATGRGNSEHEHEHEHENENESDHDNSPNDGNKVPVLIVIANYVIFIFTFALGTMDGVLTTLFVKTVLSNPDVNEQRRVGNIEETAHLILVVMFCVVVGDVVAVSSGLFAVMRRMVLFDRVRILFSRISRARVLTTLQNRSANSSFYASHH